jgi:hypothetical protein
VLQFKVERGHTPAPGGSSLKPEQEQEEHGDDRAGRLEHLDEGDWKVEVCGVACTQAGQTTAACVVSHPCSH